MFRAHDVHVLGSAEIGGADVSAPHHNILTRSTSLSYINTNTAVVEPQKEGLYSDLSDAR